MTFRYLGQPARIVLYWMGGLAIPESSWGSVGRRSLTSNEHILVSLAGPFAGFLLGGVFVGVVLLLGGSIELISQIPFLVPNLTETSVGQNPALSIFLSIGIFINVFWGLINLVPVFPLDGGQVSREVFQQLDYQDGIRKSLVLAVVASIGLAIFGFASGYSFMGLFFAILGWSNYMALQQMSGRGGGYW